MKWIGLTGGIASGKSEVGRILSTLGIHVADADYWARQALDPGREPYAQLVSEWGRTFLSPDATVDRKKIGSLVFNNIEKRKELERWVHPFVQKNIAEQKQSWTEAQVSWAVYDVPLLFESGLEGQFDRTLLVSCSESTQLQRLMKRNGLSEDEAQLRIQAQIPLDKKKKLVDDVIGNDGTLAHLQYNVGIWKSSIDAKYSSSKG